MVVASGNVVHNLRRVEWGRPDAAFDWAERFDDAVAAQMAEAPDGILKLVEHPDYALAVPTPDHFVPLLYLAGLAAADGKAAEPLLRGYAMGSISMSGYALGTGAPQGEEAAGAATLPAGVPPDQTNM